MLRSPKETPESVIQFLEHKRVARFGLAAVDLSHGRYTDQEVSELIEYMISNPDLVADLNMSGNRLTDETGLKLALFVKRNPTLRVLCLSCNLFTEVTIVAIAEALHGNTLLRILTLHDNPIRNAMAVDAAFLRALTTLLTEAHWPEWRVFDAHSGFEYLFYLKARHSFDTPMSMLAQLDAATVELESHDRVPNALCRV